MFKPERHLWRLNIMDLQGVAAVRLCFAGAFLHVYQV
jgi:hypothetical protein